MGKTIYKSGKGENELFFGWKIEKITTEQKKYLLLYILDDKNKVIGHVIGIFLDSEDSNQFSFDIKFFEKIEKIAKKLNIKESPKMISSIGFNRIIYDGEEEEEKEKKEIKKEVKKISKKQETDSEEDESENDDRVPEESDDDTIDLNDDESDDESDIDSLTDTDVDSDDSSDEEDSDDD